jgi:Ca-activated chloride channel family protein
MNFASPHLLWLLLLLAPLTALLFWSWRQRQRLLTQFISARLLQTLTTGVSKERQKLRLILVVVAIAALIFSLARPQLGFSLEESKQSGLDIVVAIDTSKSMLADDVQPNRLQRAKLAVLDLMRLTVSDRLGLVAFAGGAFLQCPLSLDEEAFRQSVDFLDVNVIPKAARHSPKRFKQRARRSKRKRRITGFWSSSLMARTTTIKKPRSKSLARRTRQG